MLALSFVSVLFYIIIIVCKASASCPCHIPCTGSLETCTCYGTCGDDGYGCRSHGGDYDFLNQIECRENEWQVQCIRQSRCPEHYTLDDTNPFSAYELEAQKDNILDDSFDNIDDNSASKSSMSWFGGNWFDFWGQNDAQFFNMENMENMKTIKANNQIYDNDITIDNQDFKPQSAQRTLQSKPILDDLGRNEAGYKIIALPLYILIICIVSSSILGMLMCAGFVYCGLHCCCPLPQTSPILTYQQRSNAIENINILQSLTLGGGYKSYNNNSPRHSIYHRMRNALHNPTADENSSIMSNDENDEYVDSEDDTKTDMNITKGNIDDITNNNDDYDFKESFALIGKCESDIDKDSDDSMIRELGNLIETRLLNDGINNDDDNTYEGDTDSNDNHGNIL